MAIITTDQVAWNKHTREKREFILLKQKYSESYIIRKSMEGANNKMNDNVVHFFAMFSIRRAQNDVRVSSTPKANQTKPNRSESNPKQSKKNVYVYNWIGRFEYGSLDAWVW